MIRLSKRLRRLADMVEQGAVLADIGTDHGYVPICLLKEGRIPRAFAMDIKKGPLLLAKEHINAYGLGDYITLRLSDGMKNLAPGEADSILIAGMGGSVMLHILEEGKAALSSAKELILQPQSEIYKVRRYLYQNGFVADREDIVYENGKYYPMMHIRLADGKRERPSYSEGKWQAVYRYAEPSLISDKELYVQYLLYKEKQYGTVFKALDGKDGETARMRREEIIKELCYVKRALEA